MISNKDILILGGTGSLGHELTSHFNSSNSIGIFSRDENKQWAMKIKYPGANFFIGDVRNKISMIRAISKFNPHIIIFAAAQKHVDICENNVSECIDTNILGIRNLIEIILENRHIFGYLDTVLFISTDKACNPVNVYGLSKSIAEKLMVEASLMITSVKFLTVRYGNVINSRGSLIPLFKDIAKDPSRKFFPITSNEMTRFFMDLPQAINLIEQCICIGGSGELWIYIAPSFYIHHIARYFSEKYSKPVVVVGIRQGEKIHEELYSAMEESRSARKGNFMSIHSWQFRNLGTGLYSNTHAIENYIDAVPYIDNMVNNGLITLK